MKRLLFLILCAFFNYFITGCNQAKEEKITDALRLFVKDSHYGLTVSGAKSKEILFKVADSTKKILNRERSGYLVDKFPAAAIKAAELFHGEIMVHIESWYYPIKLSDVRKILGDPDLIEESWIRKNLEGHSILTNERSNVKWYKYNWCSFGIRGGTVVAIKADCNMINEAVITEHKSYKKIPKMY